jgi:uracil-DNA glycosylase
VTGPLNSFVADEYAKATVFPPRAELFAALRHCPPDRARVLILGQDPYHKAGQAHGLSFSVPPGVAVPPSLRNVYKELRADLGVEPPPGGDLTGWADQGVLLLNAVLTVRAGSAASHAGRGWEHVTDAAILALNDRPQRVVFLLWGAYARRKAALITHERHVVLEAGHPSPMNPQGFAGSRPFSAANAALVASGQAPIDWSARPA